MIVRTWDDLVYHRLVTLALAIVFLGVPGPAPAQTMVDARTAEFVPSSDHGRRSNGVDLVTSYQMQIYPAGGTQPVRVVDLGKPAPQGDGRIRIDFVARLSSPLAAGVQYQARVAAIGPGGIGLSELSNPFTYGSCSPALTATAASLPAASSAGSVGVAVQAGCSWTASSGAPWLSITSGASGGGTGTVTFGVSANPATTPRTGTLTIAGQAYSVWQSGQACTYTVTPVSISAPAAGMSGTISVTTGTGCQWTNTGTPQWMTIPTAQRTGTATLSFTVARNTHPARSATLVIAGQAVNISQAQAGPLVAPSNLRIVSTTGAPR